MKNEKKNQGLTMQKMIFIGIFVVILAVGGGMLGSALTSGKAAEFLAAAEEEPEEQIIVPYSEFLINLRPVTNNERSFLRIEFSFLVNSVENEEKLLEHEARIRDGIITVLRKNTSGTIFEETEGNLRLKQDVEERINQTLGEEVVKEVYVTNIVMQ